MKALVKASRMTGDLQLQELPRPQVAPDRILAKVAYAGICHSDFLMIEDRTSIYRPPVVLGHEFSAVVAEVGAAVEGFEPGDTVVSETALEVCDNCPACADGYFEICSNKEILGWTHHGAFAEYVLLNPRFSHRLSPAVDLKAAAVAEPLTIGVEAVQVRGGIQPGEVVAVIGPGPCGILSAVAAKELGASEVFLVGRSSFTPVKMPIARQMGFEHCIDSTQVSPSEYLLDCNRGRLADLVIDATGTLAGFNDALSLVKRHGRLVQVSSIPESTPFDWPAVCHKAVDLIFVFSSSGRAWETTVEIVTRSADVLQQAITHVFPLDDYQAALEIAGDTTRSLKVVLQPTAASI